MRRQPPHRVPRPQLVYGRCKVCTGLVLVHVLAPGLTVASQHPKPTPSDPLGCRGSGAAALPKENRS